MTLPANIQARMAELAKRYESREPVSESPHYSISAGRLSLGGQECIGNGTVVLVLAAAFENKYYTTNFDAGNPLPPHCYAQALSEADLAPDPAKMQHAHFKPQAASCAECPKAVFGSAPNGRARACRNYRRLSCVQAGELLYEGRELSVGVYDDVEHYRTSPLRNLTVSPTSGRALSQYIRTISSQGLPPFGVYTQIRLVPDAKTQFRITFENIGNVEEDVLSAVLDRVQAAEASLLQPYTVSEQ